MPSDRLIWNIQYIYKAMKILYITRSPPYPLTIAGNQRTARLYRALAQNGEVDLFLAIDEHELPTQHLVEIRKGFKLIGLSSPLLRSQLAPWRFLRPLAPRLIDRLADYLANRRKDYLSDPRLSSELKKTMEQNRYDVVVCKGLALAMKTGISPDFPFVLDVDDAEQEWFQSQIDYPNGGWVVRMVAAWRWAQLKTVVPNLYRRFSRLWLVKSSDIAIPGLENAITIGVPFCLPKEGLPPLSPSDPASRIVMLLGSYYHRPNAEGLDWFIRQVWPLVRAEVPDAEFRVIGPGLAVRRAEAYSRMSGVRVLGPVPSVVPHYQECAFTIAPIWTGAGINVKVFESYAYGRPCVLTPFAFRGYEECLEDGVSVRVAKSPEDFAHACAALLRDPALRDRLAAAGHPRVMKDFSFERFAGAVGQTFAALQDGAPHG
ncbi:MAG: Glycosyl transferases group 1 [Verrucomicrobia bacterium ADurb.Bin018]|nr:MAG: Glycosyl transferases group 1 [Verrucomicrobia bacterium ADurb.Bin018]